MLDIDNVVKINLSEPIAGLAGANLNTFCLLTTEEPLTEFTNGIKKYTSASQASKDFESDSKTLKLINIAFSQDATFRTGGGHLFVFYSEGGSAVDALKKAENLESFYGFMFYGEFTNYMGVAEYVQTQDRLFFLPVHDKSALMTVISGTDVTYGSAVEIMQKGYSNTRVLYYGDEDVKYDFAMAYASRGMSVNFAQPDTTLSMHLKPLNGVVADITVNNEVKDLLTESGADGFANMASKHAVWSSGANKYFDYVYNLMWMKNDIEVNVFNLLHTSTTKVPQTELGVSMIRGAIQQSCTAAVRNGFVGAGTWTRQDTFGNRELFLSNIEQLGYYIFSDPVSRQTQQEREARTSPLLYLAIKTAGAIHSVEIFFAISL